MIDFLIYFINNLSLGEACMLSVTYILSFIFIVLQILKIPPLDDEDS